MSTTTVSRPYTKAFKLNVGPLTSFNSLCLYLAPQLTRLRNDYIHGKRPDVEWQLTNILHGKVSIAALTAFLSLAKVMRNFVDHPIKTEFIWDPTVVTFLNEVNFFAIDKYLGLFEIDERLKGGFISNKTNPLSKIIYFNEVPNLSEFKSSKEIYKWKDDMRQYVKQYFLLRIGDIFYSRSLPINWSKSIENVLSITCAELVVNALLHGREFAFVGVLRSSNKITVSVCDSGVGFQSSMKRNYPWFNDKSHYKNIDALIIASLMKVDEIGLFRSISDVIESNGHVTISSYDSEIRWEENNWSIAKMKFDYGNYKKGIDAKDILGEPAVGKLDLRDVYQGYYRIYDASLVGTRITFEIDI